MCKGTLKCARHLQNLDAVMAQHRKACYVAVMGVSLEQKTSGCEEICSYVLCVVHPHSCGTLEVRLEFIFQVKFGLGSMQGPNLISVLCTPYSLSTNTIQLLIIKKKFLWTPKFGVDDVSVHSTLTHFQLICLDQNQTQPKLFFFFLK